MALLQWLVPICPTQDDIVHEGSRSSTKAYRFATAICGLTWLPDSRGGPLLTIGDELVYGQPGNVPG